ncbi:MAG: DUF4298 domain-containing protein [Oscillospiraceae bacterium]|nr:DUF4298 domain-containing protein [Oscillospiraceae bacterium]
MELSDDIQAVIDRVGRMEELFDRLSNAMGETPELLDNDEDLQYAVKALSEYMDSGDWLHDYQMDEAGMFPDELKRGVLSQDGLYNLLCDLEASEQ